MTRRGLFGVMAGAVAACYTPAPVKTDLLQEFWRPVSPVCTGEAAAYLKSVMDKFRAKILVQPHHLPDDRYLSIMEDIWLPAPGTKWPSRINTPYEVSPGGIRTHPPDAA